MKKISTKPPQNTLFWPLVRLTVLLIIAEAVILGLNFGSILSATPVNKFIFQQVVHSPIVLIGIAKFVGAQLLLQLVFLLFFMICAKLIKILFNLSNNSYNLIGMLLWFDGVIAVFLANQIYFTHSVFAFILNLGKKLYPALQPYLTAHGIQIAFYVTTAIVGIAVVLAILGFFSLLGKHPKKSISIILLAAIGAGAYVYWRFYYAPKPVTASAPVIPSEKPNIVLLSIDYFRPGDTTYFGNKTEMTPNIDAMLKQSTVFEHAVTVIARTFPSLMSVESGDYPIKNGARFNLIDPAQVNHNETLGHTLQDNGYYSMLATDGSHFFYMTPEYGFNKVVAPTPGLNEFLLSSINDFPLSNLLMNSFVGKYLFPYNYMNRNASYTYEPKTFNKEIEKALKERPAGQPLYIHIHLTLAAWPYTWSAPTDPYPKGLNKTEQTHYRFNEGEIAVDKQFGEVMQILKAQGVFDKNAMLVLFSDHGQAFGEPGDRVTEKKYLVGNATPAEIHQFTGLNVTIGHGTDILSMKQYHPLLAFKFFGTPQNQVGSPPVDCALIDIAPTVLDYLHIANPGMQGISLMPNITAFPQTGLGDTPLYMETEFTLPSILTADPSISKVLEEGISYYNLNIKTGNLQVKPSIGKLIIKGKQRAVLQGKWLLAFYPNSTGPGTLVLVNLATKQWTLDMSNAFAQTAPLAQMWQELHDFYGKEIIMPPLPAAVSTTSTPDIVLGNNTNATAKTAPVPTAPPTQAKVVNPSSKINTSSSKKS
ncbi:MAG: sulfatase-like hydrolase/transferase [Legionellales bacterium]|nr:sulfatase-like hydrolase/transferase [Legionellales bacterium]